MMASNGGRVVLPRSGLGYYSPCAPTASTNLTSPSIAILAFYYSLKSAYSIFEGHVNSSKCFGACPHR